MPLPAHVFGFFFVSQFCHCTKVVVTKHSAPYAAHFLGHPLCFFFGSAFESLLAIGRPVALGVRECNWFLYSLLHISLARYLDSMPWLFRNWYWPDVPFKLLTYIIYRRGRRQWEGSLVQTSAGKQMRSRCRDAARVLSVYQFVFPLVGTLSGVATAVLAQLQLAGCYLIESSMLFSYITWRSTWQGRVLPAVASQLLSSRRSNVHLDSGRLILERP